MGMAKKIDFPEHDKLALISSESQSIGQFLDWLTNEKGCVICESTNNSDYPYSPTWKPIQSLLAEYFGIDQNKIEEEKLEMLELCRKGNK